MTASKNKPAMTTTEREHVGKVKSCAEAGCHRAVIARGVCHTHYMRLRRAGVIARESDVEYLSARVRRVDCGCLEWQLSRREGYGRLQRNGRKWQAHVFSYVTHIGALPDGAQVNHRCHNRACIDPTHLYAGTQAENVADMFNAGRANPATGEKNGNSKATAEAVLAIRQSKEIARIDAAKYGVSISLVYAIRKRLVWRNLADA